MIKLTNKIRFVTLGPSGTNHEMITINYLAARNVYEYEIILIEDFFVGLDMIKSDQADFMMQVAVHPDCADVVASAYFLYGIHIADTFISPSKDLGILTQIDIKNPKTLAIQPATQKYTDISRWSEIIHVSSIMNIAAGLLDGKYDSGLTTIEFADAHSDQLRVDVKIGTVDDPWLVLGKQRVSNGSILLCDNSPIVDQFRRFNY